MFVGLTFHCGLVPPCFRVFGPIFCDDLAGALPEIVAKLLVDQDEILRLGRRCWKAVCSFLRFVPLIAKLLLALVACGKTAEADCLPKIMRHSLVFPSLRYSLAFDIRSHVGSRVFHGVFHALRVFHGHASCFTHCGCFTAMPHVSRIGRVVWEA